MYHVFRTIYHVSEIYNGLTFKSTRDDFYYIVDRAILWIAHPLSVTEIHNRNLIGYFEQISQSDFKDLFLLLTTDVQSAISKICGTPFHVSFVKSTWFDKRSKSSCFARVAAYENMKLLVTLCFVATLICLCNALMKYATNNDTVK